MLDITASEVPADLQAMVDTCDTVIWMADGAERCTYLSPCIAQRLPGDPTGFLTDVWAACIHVDDRADVGRRVHAAKAGHRGYRVEYRVLKSDGTVRWVLESAAPRFAPSGEFAGYVGSMVDISILRNAVPSLAASEAQYRLLAENSNDLVAQLDAAAGYIYASPSYATVLGYVPAELQGASAYSVVHPDDVGAIQAEIAGQIHDGAAPGAVEIRKRKADGAYEWFSIKVQVMLEPDTRRKLGSVMVCTSIQAQKAAQDALRAHMRRLQSWAQVSTDLIWEVDLLSNMVWRSDKAQSVYGLRSDITLAEDTSWEDRIHPDDSARVITGFKQILDGQVERWQAEYRLRLPDGTYTHVFDKGAAIRDEDHRMVSIVGSFIDLAAQKKTEIQLSQKNRALNLRSACSQLLVRVKDKDALLNGICQLAREVGGFENAWVAFANDDDDKSVRVAASAANEADKEALLDLPLSWDRDAPGGIGRGPAGEAIRTGAVQVVEHIGQYPAFAPWRSVAERFGAVGAICLPLRNDGRTTGVLTLYSREPLRPSNDELQLLQSLADELSFGISHLQVQAERSQIRTAVSTVAAGVSASTEELFFEQIVLHMAQAVHADAAFISLFSKASGRGNILAAAVRGRIIEGFDYDLAETPCAVIFDEPLYVVEDGLSERFPKAGLPGLHDMRACVGARLESGAGEIIGSVFVIYGRRPVDLDLIGSSMRIFSARVASELERMRHVATIREQASLLDKAKDAIIVHALDGQIVYWNKGAQRLYGWSAQEAIGANLTLLQSRQDGLAAARAALDTKGEWSGDLEQLTKDGRLLAIRSEWTLMKEANGAPQSIFSISTDVTQTKADQKKIASLAYHDQLTGLPNRQALLDRLANDIEKSVRTPGALLFIDLDNFKALNDTRGHHVGDKLLQQVATRLLDCVRHADMVARLGGDEFVVMLTGLGSPIDGRIKVVHFLAEKIRARLSEPYLIGTREHHTTPSIGIAMFADDGVGVSELLKRADMAMYRAKGSGKNRLCLFDPAMQTEMLERADFESDFRQAIKEGQFVLEYQPQVHARDGVIGLEALVRWNHPVQGMVPPAKFIGFAEESGLIVPLGQWILETACRQIALWQHDPLLQDVVVAVNISARQMRDPAFVQDVCAILRRTGAPAGRLKLELTESMLIENIDETIGKMQMLCEAGISFALDDFGTGFSSLSYLKQLPIDTLKIDRSFVRDILSDSNDAAIARTIVALARSLNLGVIAEGVETQGARDLLVSLGCDCHQGYLYSKPVPAQTLAAWLTDKPSGLHDATPTWTR